MGRNKAQPRDQELAAVDRQRLSAGHEAADDEAYDLEAAERDLITYVDTKRELESKMARGLDDLALYEEMMGGVLAPVRKDLQDGMESEALLEKYAKFAAARVVTIATTDLDSGRALAAAKDILDRSKGKAVERKQIAHKFERLDERQVDAILLSELEELTVEDDGQE